jgi:hypothetical protein
VVFVVPSHYRGLGIGVSVLAYTLGLRSPRGSRAGRDIDGGQQLTSRRVTAHAVAARQRGR